MKSNHDRFAAALKKAIKGQMNEYPGQFSQIVRNDKDYPTKFAEHLIGKFKSGSVLVINDTVASAMARLEKEPDISTVYKFLGFDEPTKINVTPRPSKNVGAGGFRGC